MATLRTNISQVNADFKAIKNKMIECGVPVADGTPTANYAEKVEAVYETGRNSVASGVGTVIDDSISVFKQVPINSVSHCYISKLGGYTHEVPDDSTILAPIRLENAKPTAIKVHGANLLPYPYTQTTLTRNGITFTDNGDGTITVNGIAESRVSFSFKNKSFTLPKGKYYASICPSGGSLSTYHSFVSVWNNNTWVSEVNDIGNGVVLDVTNRTYTELRVSIYIEGGTVCDNLLVKPMLNMGTTAVPYSPYHAPIEITLPESITSLANLGLGIYDNEYNECDFVNGKYTQRCSTKTLVGTESYTYYKLGSRSRFYIGAPTDQGVGDGYYTIRPMKCDYLKADKLPGTINADDTIKNKVVHSDRNWFFYVDGTDIPDTDTWKAYLAEHNMKVVYELEMEKTEDLNMGGFNPLIEVEGGGSIEFITDSGYAPNSTVIFQTIA